MIAHVHDLPSLPSFLPPSACRIAHSKEPNVPSLQRPRPPTDYLTLTAHFHSHCLLSLAVRPASTRSSSRVCMHLENQKPKAKGQKAKSEKRNLWLSTLAYVLSVRAVKMNG